MERVSKIVGQVKAAQTAYPVPADNPFADELRATAAKIATRGKGILAADESTGTIGKRLGSINVENNENNRRRYRELLFTSQGIEEYISGVIMFEETLFSRASDGRQFVDILKAKGIIPGIKTDKGTRAMPYFPGEKYAQGLTDLDVRSKKYYEQGARFAKWRSVVKMNKGWVSDAVVQETAWTLARYAAISQANGLVPIVEPEILMDGEHPIETCQYWTERILAACYKALSDQRVILEGTLLKPNMVLAGAQWEGKRAIEKNALCTVTALRRTVPAAVPGIMFLSGGQSEEEATMNLNAINKYNLPWSASFSYGRALQKSCLQAWKGSDANTKAGQAAFMKRAKANAMAQLGKYDGFAADANAKQSLYVKGYSY